MPPPLKAPFPWFGGKRKVAALALRIALCGYAGEHEMPGWREVAWTAARGYAGADNENRHAERVWLSPHCLVPSEQLTMF